MEYKAHSASTRKVALLISDEFNNNEVGSTLEYLGKLKFVLTFDDRYAPHLFNNPFLLFETFYESSFKIVDNTKVQ